MNQEIQMFLFVVLIYKSLICSINYTLMDVIMLDTFCKYYLSLTETPVDFIRWHRKVK